MYMYVYNVCTCTCMVLYSICKGVCRANISIATIQSSYNNSYHRDIIGKWYKNKRTFFLESFHTSAPSSLLNSALYTEARGWGSVINVSLMCLYYFPIMQALLKFLFIMLDWLLVPHSHGVA